MKKKLVCILVSCLCGIAQAAVTVSDVKVQQRWPWNGLVDIDYTVTCDTPDADIYIYPTALDGDRMIAMSPRTLTGEGASAPVKAGTYRMTWDMAKDQPNLHSSAFKVNIHAYTGAAPYMIVDLSSGPESTHYPVEYSNTCPDLTDDIYRTTKMVFKLILPGTFMMGSPTTESGRTNNEDLHQVTLTQPFYMAIFECTHQQWYQVTGVYPYSAISDYKYIRPAQGISWDGIRGTVAALTWPDTDQVDNDSFMGKLRMRTGLTFDLPTEAQWEYACRAGTSTPWISGDSIKNQVYGIFGTNWRSPQPVGWYQPNAWGLYDMHGNVWEWCVDGWMGNLGTTVVIDPKIKGDTRFRILRGGCWGEKTTYTRSAYRTNYWSSGDFTTYGVRVSCRPLMK